MQLVKNTLPYLIVILSLISINQWATYPIGNTFTDWILCATMIFLFIKGIKSYYNKSNNTNLTFFHGYMIWVGICILRGFFVAVGYWDWKNLTSGILTLTLPVSLYLFTNIKLTQSVLSKWIQFALPLSLIILIFNETGILGFYIAPISLIALFIPVLNQKWKVIVVFISLFVILSDLSVRSSVIKYSMPLIFVIGYYTHFLEKEKLIRFCRLFLFFIPLVLLSLATTGIFNVFKMDEYLGGEVTVASKSKFSEDDEILTADTRSFLYEEVLSSAIRNNYFLWGRTPARGNDSETFGEHMAEDLGTGRYERYDNEVGILNIFTWTGIIGVFLYFLVFWKATQLAIYKSNSIFIKILGLYVAFRWTYSFVEDFNRFDIMNLTLWMMIAMCYSKSFRVMTDKEVKIWIRGIFDNRYRQLKLATIMNSYSQKNGKNTNNICPPHLSQST